LAGVYPVEQRKQAGSYSDLAVSDHSIGGSRYVSEALIVSLGIDIAVGGVEEAGERGAC